MPRPARWSLWPGPSCDSSAALTPPTGDVRQVAKIQAAIEKAVDGIDRKPRLLVEEPSPFTRATTLAEAYGLEVCGRG